MDPIEGTKLASIAPMEQTDPTSGPNAIEGGDSGASFKDVLNEKMDETQGADVDGVDAIEAPDSSQMRERVDNFMKDVLNDEKELDKIMSRASNGADMSNQELLKMQALVYGYAQKVDLATKVVEKSTAGVKQMMQTQV